MLGGKGRELVGNKSSLGCLWDVLQRKETKDIILMRNVMGNCLRAERIGMGMNDLHSGGRVMQIGLESEMVKFGRAMWSGDNSGAVTS